MKRSWGHVLVLAGIGHQFPLHSWGGGDSPYWAVTADLDAVELWTASFGAHPIS